MKKGYLLLTLHAHLPFVRHPEHDFFLEERWLYEAITETYIPLIEIYDAFLNENIPFRITMSVTPPLASMLMDELLQERYVQHMHKLIELSEKEVERTKNDGHFNYLAKMYRDQFRRALHIFENQYGRNLITAFKKFQDAGCLEIITCGATHGFLPLMQTVPASIRAQVGVACEHYEKTFGRRAKGIWLPECGYYPGYDKVLAENGLSYFFVDTHGILHGEPRPKYGVFAPVRTPHGVHAFGRDMESSKQVWSAVEGYPGDYEYREYYRDIGFDLDYDYIKPYIHPDGFRLNTGIKYFRITGTGDHKEPYDFHRANEKAASHAGNFLFNREKQVEYLFSKLGRQPVVVAPYDAELYGHWWFEGPQFLNYLIRKTVFDSPTLELITAPEYIARNPNIQPSEPSYSSWGHKGYAEVWLESSNDWIYRHLHHASEKMTELARRFSNPNELQRRALNQAARELLLAESSDWAFIMKTGTMVSYAVWRTREHVLRFLRLYDQLMNDRIDFQGLLELEGKDNIFPEINYQRYA
jgi:1,4-alpha-glucan branching enzyme